MNQWVGEWEPHHLFTFPSCLRVTNGNLVMLTFTSAEEIFLFFFTGAVKLNFHVLGFLPTRRHKRVLSPIYEGRVQVKTPLRCRGLGATAAAAMDNLVDAPQSWSARHTERQTPSQGREAVFVGPTLILSREQNDLSSGNKPCLVKCHFQNTANPTWVRRVVDPKGSSSRWYIPSRGLN